MDNSHTSNKKMWLKQPECFYSVIISNVAIPILLKLTQVNFHIWCMLTHKIQIGHQLVVIKNNNESVGSHNNNSYILGSLTSWL